MSDGRLSINVQICGRNFRLSIDPEHEERVRAAAEEVNERVRGYKARFNDREDQELLSMTALQAFIDLQRLQAEKNESMLADIVATQIERIDAELSEKL